MNVTGLRKMTRMNGDVTGVVFAWVDRLYSGANLLTKSH
jgi:hypothetical protein